MPLYPCPFHPSFPIATSFSLYGPQVVGFFPGEGSAGHEKSVRKQAVMSLPPHRDGYQTVSEREVRAGRDRH